MLGFGFVVIDKHSVLILSGFLFCIGFLGLLRQPKIIKTFVSLEIMLFSSIVNFCYFSGCSTIKSGHIAAFAAVLLGGITLSIMFAILATQFKENKTLDVLKEDKIEIKA